MREIVLVLNFALHVVTIAHFTPKFIIKRVIINALLSGQIVKQLSVINISVQLKLLWERGEVVKRLVIITIGKTHSGKSTFAKQLEKKLDASFVMDQDNHAEVVNSYYKKLQPKSGPNTLKHSISKLIIDYAKKYTDFHIIVSSANRTKSGRKYLFVK